MKHLQQQSCQFWCTSLVWRGKNASEAPSLPLAFEQRDTQKTNGPDAPLGVWSVVVNRRRLVV